MGPVEVGVVEVLLEVDDPVEALADAPVDVPVEAAVVMVLLLSDRVALALYVESLLGPPQYSSLSPLQSMEQPLAAGSLPPVARMDPAPKVLPQ